jgi:hypothetical protein
MQARMLLALVPLVLVAGYVSQRPTPLAGTTGASPGAGLTPDARAFR